MTRILTSVVAIPILIWVVQFAPVGICISLILVAMLLALSEYFLFAEARGAGAFSWIGYAMASTILLSFYFTESHIELFFPLCSAIAMIAALISRRDFGRALEATAFTVFGAWYLGGLMGYLVGVRMIGSGGELGADLLMMLLVVVWAGDTFAYLFGRWIGKHKLAEVSPNKTWEGSIAGFIFSILAALGCHYLFIQQLAPIHAAILGALVGITGQIGDLCESLLKRSASIKDSGSILPGHGGMLDRIDSLLFGAPTIYYYFYFFLRS
jgi:phosphatidate cytidylyltransferase